MDVVGSFVDASAYTQRYQRNNKRSGLKNLRCFPMCSDEHKLRGFCGRPAYVQVSNPLGKDLCSYACFVKLPGKKDNSKNNTQHLIKIGDIISVTDMESQTRSKQDPFQHYIRGEMPEDIIENDPQLTFIFNKNKKGWHYGWVANKHTCDSEHVLRAYIFEKTDNGKTLIARHFVDCPSFTIFCRRRQRQNLDRLPPQLKVQLELQDAMKKKTSKC